MVESLVDSNKRRFTLALAAWLLAWPAFAQPAPGSEALARQKIDSQLLHELDRKRGKKVAPLETGIVVDAAGRVKIDVRAEVDERLLARIAKLGGEVLSSSPPHRSVLARFPLLKLLELAGWKEVLFVMPAAEAMTQPARTPAIGGRR
jgi:hypothetical protein